MKCRQEVVLARDVTRYEPFVTAEGVRQVLTACPCCGALVPVTPVAEEYTYALLLASHQPPEDSDG